MTDADTLDRAREALRQEEWTDAFTRLSAVDREVSLQPEDLEGLATAAYLIGRDADSVDAWSRAHNGHLSAGNIEPAVRCAFWLGLGLLLGGERARGSGWMARGQRLLDDAGVVDGTCAEHGYLRLPAGLACLAQRDFRAAYGTFSEAEEIGARFQQPDLLTLCRLGRGQALIGLGDTTQGVPLLDEAMVTVESGEASPIVAGTVYCAVIEACWEIFDLRRAQEWTAALSRWCDDRPDLVPFRGQCLIRRAELMQLRGDWPHARDEAREACERLMSPRQPAAGAAFYLQGELHRLAGDFDSAEGAYQQASRHGRRPQPGLAQLRLAQGQVDTASAAIRRALDGAMNPAVRSTFLPVQVEVMLAAGDLESARTAADELTEIAAAIDASLPRARAARARGAVLLEEGDPRAALGELRHAEATWKEIGAPYEIARTHVLMGLACRALGDSDGAELELDVARSIFIELGATPEVARIEKLLPDDAPRSGALPGGLSPREGEVLRLVATGRTNRAIGTELFISEKTVARHVSNIFVKLNVSSRAAATAWAYEHDLV
jgi:DNA-binding CsgD family transcriptional regulator